MAFAVWKKVLTPKVGDVQYIDIPRGSRLLYAGRQGSGGDICVWFSCDPDLPLASKGVVVLPTGEKYFIDDNELQYLGTVMFNDGQLAFHVFGVHT